MTAEGALVAFAPLIGAGGISGIVIAILGVLQSKRGAKDPSGPSLGKEGMQHIGAILVSDDIGRTVAAALLQVAEAIRHDAQVKERLNGTLGQQCDEIAASRRMMGRMVEEMEEARRDRDDERSSQARPSA